MKGYWIVFRFLTGISGSLSSKLKNRKCDGMRNDTEAFLIKHGMHYKTIDLDTETRAFAKQMRDGLEGKTSSLMMIPTFVTIHDNITTGEEVIVMDAGGTNFRVATAHVNINGSISISNLNNFPMPGKDAALTADQFFEAIVDYMEPVLHSSDKAGFCFSYPCEMLPNKDGRILGLSKEVRVEGIAGVLLGESLNNVLKRRGRSTKLFVILNDTVATMLGGMAVSRACYEDYVGYILGTGTNNCYLEKCNKIAKSAEAKAIGGRMAVNMESGGYDGFLQGDYDKELDDQSSNPGDHIMEKMISGAYQGTLIYKTIIGGVKEGLLSASFGLHLDRLGKLTGRQIDEFCLEPKGDNVLAMIVAGINDDYEILNEIIDASFERSSRITAITFAAILTHTNMGKDPEKAVCIMAEGTTFEKSVLFRKKLDSYIKNYLGKQLGLNCVVINERNVTVTGAAIAALM